MKINDAHAHVGIDYFYYKIKKDNEFNFPLEKLFKLMKENKVDKSIVSWCPSVKEITCCSPTDLFLEKNKIISKCPSCGKVVAELTHDPYRKYNIQLAEEIKNQGLTEKIIPFFVIHLQNPFLKEEIKFYLKNYKKFGLKFHTLTSKRSILTIQNELTRLKLPILVHTGTEEFTSPANLIEFAKNYSGNVLMAHAARLSSKYLAEINSIDNLFVDITPLTSFYRRIKTKDFSTILEGKESFEDINSPEDIYYFLLKHVNYKKLLFGTDVPWCNKFGSGYSSEVSILNNLKIDQVKKEFIANKNFEKFLENVL